MRAFQKTSCALLVGISCASAAQQARAVPIITVWTDSATLTTTIYNPLAVASTTVPSPYGATNITISKYPTSAPYFVGYWLTFHPNSGFFASANNLGGGKTSILSAQLAFDIAFDSPVHLTTNIFENGIRSSSGNGRATANAADLAGGIVVSQLDNPAIFETRSHSFSSSAFYSTDAIGPGSWFLYDSLTGFSKAYAKYHVVIDNDLIAESLASATPGFAGIAKKEFSILFTFDGTNGLSPTLGPEPATFGMLLVASVAMLVRRGRTVAR